MGVLRGLLRRVAQLTAPRGPLLELGLGDEQFQLEVARDGAALQRGLAGRRRLAAAAGLVLVLPPQTDQGAITTRGMRFSIDVVFLDGKGRVLEIVADLGPGLFPGHPVPDGGIVVVELAAGAAARVGLAQGHLIPELSLAQLSTAGESDKGLVS